MISAAMIFNCISTIKKERKSRKESILKICFDIIETKMK